MTLRVEMGWNACRIVIFVSYYTRLQAVPVYLSISFVLSVYFSFQGPLRRRGVSIPRLFILLFFLFYTQIGKGKIDNGQKEEKKKTIRSNPGVEPVTLTGPYPHT